MSCQVNITLKEDPAQFIDKVQKAVEEASGTFNGSVTAGTFSIPILKISKIAGSYTVSGDTVSVDITDKPVLVSCDRIQKYVEQKMAEA